MSTEKRSDYNISFNGELTETTSFSFMLFNELLRFHGEIGTYNFPVSNSEIITLDFTV